MIGRAFFRNWIFRTKRIPHAVATFKYCSSVSLKSRRNDERQTIRDCPNFFKEELLEYPTVHCSQQSFRTYRIVSVSSYIRGSIITNLPTPDPLSHSFLIVTEESFDYSKQLDHCGTSRPIIVGEITHSGKEHGSRRLDSPCILGLRFNRRFGGVSVFDLVYRVTVIENPSQWTGNSW